MPHAELVKEPLWTSCALLGGAIFVAGCGGAHPAEDTLSSANTLVGPSTNIYRFDLSARTTSTLLSQIGFTVLGAAVGTCDNAQDP